MEERLHSFGNFHNTVSNFSFAPYYQFLQKKIQQTDKIKRFLMEYYASRIEEQNVQQGIIPKEELWQYNDLFEVLYASLTNVSLDGNKDIWGITTPFSAEFVFATNSLYDFFIDKESGWIKEDFIARFEEIGSLQLKKTYAIILKRMYDIDLYQVEDMEYKYFDPKDQINKYYRVHYDYNFIDIISLAPLPEIDMEIVRPYTTAEDLLSYLTTVLPLSNFEFRGFGILTLVDITKQANLYQIKERLWTDSYDTEKESIFMDIKQAINSLLGTNKIGFGIMPFIKMNSQYVSSTGDGLIVTNAGQDLEFQAFLEDFTSKGTPVFIDDINDTPIQSLFLYQRLKQTPYSSYLLVPIYHQKKMYGVMELYAKEKGLITNNTLHLLEQLYIDMAQLIKMGHELFENKIREVISDQFTLIQPAVSWKFRDVAWQYATQEYYHGKIVERIPIVFKEVYPFYGAVDIRNSSLMRNTAIRADWQLQLNWLTKTIDAIAPHIDTAVNNTLQKLLTFLATNNEDVAISGETISMIGILDKEVFHTLTSLTEQQPSTRPVIQAYLQAMDADKGECHSNRRSIDESMKAAIATIHSTTEEMNEKIQELYPAYFDKFRTDGVEYDLYIGQSISPGKKLSPEILQEIRSIQLEYMIKVALANKQQQPALAIPLKTTQLIFVNPDIIDITFREDEKRLDVEGSYNIRYQLIKKRIDKVHIKNTRERLTQPGKIAVVYMNDSDIKDYTTFLQDKITTGELADLEYLSLEDLQGVTGLKALRVHVNRT